MNIKDYWDKKIIEWEDSTRDQRNLSIIEKLASKFRNPLKVRTETCLNILKNFVKDREVLEVGCGSGYFALDLYKKAKPSKIIGIDISKNAINRAIEMSTSMKLNKKLIFQVGNVSELDLPKTDVVIGLGFLDYLAEQEIKRLFHAMQCKFFLFTFPEKRNCVRRYLHLFYMAVQRCPKHFYYTKSIIADCINDQYGKIHFLSNKKLGLACIVHNLPIDE